MINSIHITRIAIDGKPQTILSSEVQVGDLLLIEEDQMLPSDLILINSSTEDGSAFIQTSSLDGEKNLKKRSIPLDFIYSESKSFEGLCTCDEPNAELYEFKGNL